MKITYSSRLVCIVWALHSYGVRFEDLRGCFFKGLLDLRARRSAF